MTRCAHIQWPCLFITVNTAACQYLLTRQLHTAVIHKRSVFPGHNFARTRPCDKHPTFCTQHWCAPPAMQPVLIVAKLSTHPMPLTGLLTCTPWPWRPRPPAGTPWSVQGACWPHRASALMHAWLLSHQTCQLHLRLQRALLACKYTKLHCDNLIACTGTCHFIG